jgi:large subunit ribosomal protein L5e
MGFVKVVKNKAYFRRYQVKYRRRREGKTDYRARRHLITQDKTKYNAPKYRLVVRITNNDVICQIIFAKIIGDVTIVAAYSHELKRYGLPVGLTNYAAAYATGLLVARRLLQKFNLDTKYVGLKKANGEGFLVRANKDGPRPFKALLDVGLARTTTGAKIFGALKGALDGGLNIPHSDKRFYGYDRESKKLDPKKLRSAIYAQHVVEYMRKLSDEDPSRYQKQFSRYIAAGITPDKLEDVIRTVHRKIREDPTVKHTTKHRPAKPKSFGTKPKFTREERAAKSLAKKQALSGKAPAAEDVEE